MSTQPGPEMLACDAAGSVIKQFPLVILLVLTLVNLGLELAVIGLGAQSADEVGGVQPA